MHYVSTFPSGFDEVAEKALLDRLTKTTIIRRLDGGLEYRTNAQPKIVSSLRFFQNSFIVIEPFTKLTGKPVDTMVRFFLKRGLETKIASVPGLRGFSSFRLNTLMNNHPVTLAPKMRTAVESRIRRATRLTVARSGADVEVWFSSRSGGVGYIMLRFTKRRATEKDLHPGELPPETAHLLILCSEPSHQDVFLDPFCGYGGIVVERLASFRAERLIGIDINEKLVAGLRSRVGKPASIPVVFQAGDASNLKNIGRGEIDRIVTDPPWGAYRKQNTEALYRGFFAEMDRVLAPKGVAVLLAGRDCPVADLAKSAEQPLILANSYNVLISGKKATVHILKR